MTIYTDSATVVVDVSTSGVEQHVHSDAATVVIDISASGVDIHGKPDFTGEGVAYNQFNTFEAEAQFDAEDFNQFEAKLRFGVFNA